MKNFDGTMCYMKAIGIICVVAGHSFTGSAIEHFVGLFHMPLFFFVSGYLFKEKYLQDVKFYFSRKLKNLWYPTFLWIVIAVLLHNILFSFGIYNPDYPYNETIPYLYSNVDFVKAFASAIFLRCNELLFAGLWFVRMLFVASILCYYIIKYFNNRKLILVGGGILLLIVVVLLLIEEVYSIKVVPYLPFYSSFFFLFGFIWKKYYSKEYEKELTSIKMLFSCFIILLIGYYWVKSSMLGISLIKMFPYTITAIAGIFMVLSICKRIPMINTNLFSCYLSYLGNHTYDVLMMHIMSFKIVTLFLILIYDLDYSEIANFPVCHIFTEKGWFLLYILVGVNLPLALRYYYSSVKTNFFRNKR